MCSSEVTPEAEAALAQLLDDFRRALQPDDPESVTIGPVDFGHGFISLARSTPSTDPHRQKDGRP